MLCSMFMRPAHTWHYEPVFVLSHAGEVFGYSSCFLCVPGCFLKCLVGGIFLQVRLISILFVFVIIVTVTVAVAITVAIAVAVLTVVDACAVQKESHVGQALFFVE